MNFYVFFKTFYISTAGSWSRTVKVKISASVSFLFKIFCIITITYGIMAFLTFLSVSSQSLQRVAEVQFQGSLVNPFPLSLQTHTATLTHPSCIQ